MFTCMANLGLSTRNHSPAPTTLPPLGAAKEKFELNIATGNLCIHHQDAYLCAPGISVSVNRFYNSLDMTWRIGPSRRLTIPSLPCQPIIRTKDDGHVQEFKWDDEAFKYFCVDGDQPGVWLIRDHVNRQWVYGAPHSNYQETYDYEGRLLLSSDADGNTISYHYSDSDGKLQSIKTVANESIVFNYNTDNLIKSISRNTSGNNVEIVIYDYDIEKQLKKVIFSGKYELNYEYGSKGRVKKCSQADGIFYAFSYNGQGLVQSFSDGEGRKHEISYQTQKRQVDLKHPDQSQTTFSLDDQMRLVKVDGALGFLKYEYSEEYGQIATYDYNGRIRKYRYHQDGSLYSEKLEADFIERQEKVYEYDEATKKLLTVHKVDVNTKNTRSLVQNIYDGNNRLKYTIDDIGAITEYQYEEHGLISFKILYIDVFIDPSTLYVVQQDAKDGEVTKVVRGSAKQESIFYEYDHRGQLIRTVLGDQTIDIEHDVFGRIIKKALSNTTEETFAYDAIGRPLSTHNKLGISTTHSYDKKQIETETPFRLEHYKVY